MFGPEDPFPVSNIEKLFFPSRIKGFLSASPPSKQVLHIANNVLLKRKTMEIIHVCQILEFSTSLHRHRKGGVIIEYTERKIYQVQSLHGNGINIRWRTPPIPNW